MYYDKVIIQVSRHDDGTCCCVYITVHVSITCQSHALISLVKINLMLSEIEAAASCPALVELDLRIERCGIIM